MSNEYLINAIKQLSDIILSSIKVAFHVHDPHRPGLRLGDVDDLMVIYFVLFLIKHKIINIDHFIVYLVNDTVEDFLFFHPNLLNKPIALIDNNCITQDLADLLIQKASIVGIMAPLENIDMHRDEIILNALLKRSSESYTFSQGKPIHQENEQPSYNFKFTNLPEKIKLDNIISFKVPDTVVIDYEFLRIFLPEEIISQVKGFSIMRLAFMPSLLKIAPGLVSITYGRGNNLEKILWILSYHFFNDERLVDGYKNSKVSTSSACDFVRDVFSKYNIPYNFNEDLINNYYNKIKNLYLKLPENQNNPFDEDMSFWYGMKVWNLFYHTMIVTKFGNEMPDISYQGTIELLNNGNFKMPDSFCYDLLATVKAYIHFGFVSRETLNQLCDNKLPSNFYQ